MERWLEDNPLAAGGLGQDTREQVGHHQGIIHLAMAKGEEEADVARLKLVEALD